MLSDKAIGGCKKVTNKLVNGQRQGGSLKRFRLPTSTDRLTAILRTVPGHSG
jgi:hypothetical protein